MSPRHALHAREGQPFSGQAAWPSNSREDRSPGASPHRRLPSPLAARVSVIMRTLGRTVRGRGAGSTLRLV